jgi:RNA polymerase sigma-70 factor (ECF subfamily)
MSARLSTKFFSIRFGYNRHMDTGREKQEIPRNIDDVESVERLRSGGSKALAEMYQQHRGRLRRMVELRIDPRLMKRIDADDVLQEGFVDISKRLDDYLADPSMPVFVWMRFLVAQQLAAVQRWHFQRQKRDPRREEPVVPAKPTMDSGEMAREFSGSLTSPSQAAQRNELTERMRELLDTMEVADREILVLRHFEELTNAEAAAELGLTPGAASKRYIRALSKLKGVVS